MPDEQQQRSKTLKQQRQQQSKTFRTIQQSKPLKQLETMAQFAPLVPLAYHLIGDLTKGLTQHNNGAFETFQSEQQLFNQNMCQTVRDNHNDLSNRHSALENEFRNDKTRFAAEMAGINSRQDSLKDLMNANQRATENTFELAAAHLSDVQNNFNKDVTVLHTLHGETSSRLNNVNEKYHELDKHVALKDSNNKTAFNKAFDQINTMEQHRVVDLERFGRLEDKHIEMDKRVALRDKDIETAFNKTFDQLSTMEKHRAGDLQRFCRVEDRQQEMFSDITASKVATADLRSRVELNANHNMLLMEKHNELNKAVALQDRDNKIAFDRAYDQIKTMEKHRAGDLDRFGGLENKHVELEKSIALRDQAYGTAFNAAYDRLNTMEKYRAGDLERFDNLEGKHDELERSIVHIDAKYEKAFNKTFDQLSTMEKYRADDLERFNGIEDKHNELERSFAHKDNIYATAFNNTFDRLNTMEKHRASDLERLNHVEDSQQELYSGIVSTKKATDDLTVRVELNDRKNMMAFENAKNQISNLDTNIAAVERQYERLADDNKLIRLEAVKGQKDTASVKNQLEQKAEEDKKIMDGVAERIRQVETHSESTLQKAESIQKDQEQFQNEIKAIGNKAKEYLVIGTAVGAVLYFGLKRGP